MAQVRQHEGRKCGTSVSAAACFFSWEAATAGTGKEEFERGSMIFVSGVNHTFLAAAIFAIEWRGKRASER